ncbi:MAG TPA: hypothetical protein VJ724_04005 [Tahibacter sp.]|nr:hypothetical protein [Tahibacter sp.]
MAATHPPDNPWGVDTDTWVVDCDMQRTRVACKAIAPAVDADTVCCAVTVEGDDWDRREKRPGNIVADFRIVLPQVLMRLARLRALLGLLDVWLADFEPFEYKVCVRAEVRQDFLVCLDRQPKLVYAIGKHAVTLRYDVGESMIGYWAFLVDESGVRIWRDSLAAFLEARG